MTDNIRVLVIDDDFRVAEIHSSFVEGTEGFEVVGSALNAEQAIEMTRQLRPDLVLLDIYLPDIPGTEILLGRLQSEQSVDCFVLTAARDAQTVRRCLSLGARHYLVKPFTKQDLVDRLTSYRQWRSELRIEDNLSQKQIDQIFQRVEQPLTGLPKGLSAETLGLVTNSLAQSSELLTAEEVAQMTGVSRVSVRRYLRYLVDENRAALVHDYGSPGRPRHQFKLVD